MNSVTARSMLRLSHIKRWAVIPTHQNQSVAEHSFNCVALLMWTADLLHVRFLLDKEMIVAALIHDAEEAVTGDIPSPVKASVARNDESKELESITARTVMLNLVDAMEAYVFMLHEQSLGNTSIAWVAQDTQARVINYFEQFKQHMWKERKVLVQLDSANFLATVQRNLGLEQHPIQDWMNRLES